MSSTEDRPTTAEHLAQLVTGKASLMRAEASVQRSHRFPLFLFIQIENLAKMGGVPVSLIINQLIEAGLEAVKAELPEDAVARLAFAEKEQIERKTVSTFVEVKNERKVTTRRPKKQD